MPDNYTLTDSHFHDWESPSFPAINAGCEATDVKQRYDKYSKYSFIKLAAAMGPWETKNRSREELEELFEVLRSNILAYNVHFIGETGLDYHYSYGSPEIQEFLLVKHLVLAGQLGKKVLIHCRQADNDMIRILKDFAPKEGGVIHCCDGNCNLIETALSKGFYISFAGNITYKNADNLRQALKTVPKDRLLLETDSPYLTPVPFRGSKNSPSLIIHTYIAVAHYLNMTLDELTALVYSNFCTFVKDRTH